MMQELDNDCEKSNFELEVKHLDNHWSVCVRQQPNLVQRRHSIISKLEPITGRKSETAIPRIPAASGRTRDLGHSFSQYGPTKAGE